jgi:thiamine-phosphate pyrophosphorylase
VPWDVPLYLVTDRRQTRGRPLVDVARSALDGGVRALQLREKDLLGAELLGLAVELREITRRYGALLLVNDRVDVALAADADGVHLGQGGMPVAAARRLLGPARRIGVSVHTLAEAAAAAAARPDFLVFGPVYATPSKGAFGAPRGTAELGAVVAATDVPVLAIGGITVARVAEVCRVGAAGIAVISAVCAADDPARAARELLAALHSQRLSAS